MKTIKAILTLSLLITLVIPVSSSYGAGGCDLINLSSAVSTIKNDPNMKAEEKANDIAMIKKFIVQNNNCDHVYFLNPQGWENLYFALDIKNNNLFPQLNYPVGPDGAVFNGTGKTVTGSGVGNGTGTDIKISDTTAIIKDQPDVRIPKLYWRTQFNWTLANQSFYVSAVPSELLDLGKITYKTIHPSFGCKVDLNGLVTIEDVTIKGRCLIVAFIEEFIFGEGTSLHIKYVPTVSEELIIPVSPVPVKTNIVKEKCVVSKNKKSK